MRVATIIASITMLAACQSGPATPDLAAAPGMTAPQAVIAAADAAPRGVAGNFALIVRRAEMVGPRLFLNSEEDYRDQRNLSIAIDPRALRGLRQRLGPDLKSALLGRDIRVRGLARRTRIDFTTNGRPTGKYYFQTHVAVTNPIQISIIG